MKSVSAFASIGVSFVCTLLSAASAQTPQHYLQTNLVADTPGIAAVTDPNLVNPWGLSRSSTSPWWVSDNGPGLSTLYDGTGKIVPLVVTIPPAKKDGSLGTPTGTIFNGGSGFEVAPHQPAIFLFVTEDGTISGWNPNVAPTNSIIKVNQNAASVFKGATIATTNVPLGGTPSFLYVADFRKALIQVYDSSFNPVTLAAGAFQDDQIPAGYAPFNVQNIGGSLYVAYALQGSDKHDEVDGPGLGYVDVFTPAGKLLRRLQHGSWLNAPWGLVEASGDFGKFSHDILVGQFGSGEIVAYNAQTGLLEGTLRDAKLNPIQIPGLWGIAFGNGTGAGPANALYFAAGPDHESHGLLGTITAIENAQGNDR